jgi:hypothetical protein
MKSGAEDAATTEPYGPGWWRPATFLKRDVGWLFGTLYVLAMMQAGFFAYDQMIAVLVAAIAGLAIDHWM